MRNREEVKSTTIGVEFEFILTHEGRQKYDEFRKDKNKTKTWKERFQISHDHCNIAEFKSHIVPINKFDFDTNVIGFRRDIVKLLDHIGVSYIYYGTHFSVWNFSKKEFVKLSDVVQNKNLLKIFFRSSSEITKKNIYVDPLLPLEKVGHAVLKLSREEVREDLDELIDLHSFRAMLRLLCLLPNIKNDLSWGPIPGGAIRVSKDNRVEFVLGWLPPHVERMIFTKMIESVTNQNLPEKNNIEEETVIICGKNKVGVCWISGVDYKDPFAIPVASVDIKTNTCKKFKQI